MSEPFYETMALTLKLSFLTTLLLFPIGMALAYFLAYTKSRLKPFLEALVSMPLVLPPSVLGFYLLMAFSPNNAFGAFLQDYFDIRLVFSFSGLVVASMLFSLPFMITPIQNGFNALSSSLMEASYTLGKSKLQTLFFVLLPAIRPALISGAVISFAHTVGEFGVVLMIGGNIEGETKVASLAIYDEVESLNYAVANEYAFSLFVLSFALLFSVYFLNGRFDGALNAKN